uniref:SnoaL-like domain-containing protein n=1 Tax=Craspedostauros australis TaxID=1486917 RepID=A0A7R9ZQQ5_9STRA|mmetsp:Transcript_6126/g.16699  ORF Transcript_6126/g.16699 Transcript_6126/m.16699 type:complete len:160 (+) Transcript_6126:258-737(+)|eukprot:CAMPEP_0198116738 /NCGR_PEP_ID=MMETSP1442-20131203/14403_1 /TAXON_ID= /ORGANISM="Craspedostauros australis, Strain CCMP3328" /LENGTH=159 /DNA_ID=CAMNT_0043774639 /DNA_START=195 /DNA_END=674 /DNA_ORIENTATION=+
MTTPEIKPPVPPFSLEDAVKKVRMAENAWNTRDPDKVKMAYTIDSEWRNRSTFVKGRDEIRKFLDGKWDREQEYRLIKEIWAHGDNRIAVRFAYEYHNADGKWFRAYGNENWEFNEHGLMQKRHASINDVAIEESDRLFHWPQDGPRPDEHPGLTELGL